MFFASAHAECLRPVRPEIVSRAAALSYITALDAYSACLESESESASPVNATAMLRADEAVPALMQAEVDVFNSKLADGKAGS